MKETQRDRTAACGRFQAELQAYLEGEDASFVSAHAAGCVSCRGVVEELEALRRAARELPLAEPSPLLWANIRAQLAAAGMFAEKVGFWDWFRQFDLLRRPIPVMAFACLLLLGCCLAVPRSYPERETGATLAVSPGRTVLRSMSLIGDSAALEPLVRELEETFRAREGSFAPDLKATYDSSLQSLDASIRECSDSLRREPDNSLAHEYLLAAYSQKAEVLSSALEFDDGR
jgi:hypothetical protein